METFELSLIRHKIVKCFCFLELLVILDKTAWQCWGFLIR